jgi:hypothetical protein
MSAGIVSVGRLFWWTSRAAGGKYDHGDDAFAAMIVKAFYTFEAS